MGHAIDAAPAGRRALTALIAAAAALILLAMAMPDQVEAQGVEIRDFEATPSFTQAGGHPDVTVRWKMDQHFAPSLGDPCACNDAKDIVVNLPPGMIGNPHATPRCSALEFALDICPVDSQIGTAKPDVCLSSGFCVALAVPLYNLVPRPEQAGLIGFKTLFFSTSVYTILSARTGGDYGLRATTEGIEHVLPVQGFEQVLWGVPADPVHDGQRYCDALPPIPGPTGCSSNSPLTPFMQNPTTCRVPLSSTIDILAYDGGRTHAEAEWPATTGCGQLAFNPSLVAKPTTNEADAASGVTVDLTVPQSLSPNTPSASQIEAVRVELPAGFSINPNAANGKTACTDAAARFGTELAAQCPEFAKVGALTVESAVLPGELPGAIYLGQPLPGERYRLFLVADGFGLHVKLPGTITADPATGRLTAVFANLPQTPFTRFNMHFFGAERGLLATPTQCGTYAVESRFTPWNSDLSDQTATQFFSIDSGPGGRPCPAAARPFAPTAKAFSSGNMAGAETPFWVRIDREDGDQFLSGLTVATPPGFSGKLAGIPYCPESALAAFANPLYTGISEIAASACPAASQIGVATVGAGAGSRPLYTNGRVFLAGPHQGAPLSLVVVVPAVSGPYDLGNVAVRAAIHVDPVSAQITTLSDPLPAILEGIPLRLRSVFVHLDRPGFIINPTNCGPMAVNTRVRGDQGGIADLTSHFQVSNCATLDFEPKLGVKLRGNVKRRGHPSLQAVYRAEPGGANLRRAAVTLPPETQLDNANITSPCTRVQFAANACPPESVHGTAIAYTPVLDKPLRGPVYLRTGRHKLPDLVADLHGQVDFQLAAKIDAVDGGLRTIFTSTPDVPVTRFVLRMRGGSKGLLINTDPLCRGKLRARSVLRGQNGARSVTRPRLQLSCGKRGKRSALADALAIGRGQR